MSDLIDGEIQVIEKYIRPDSVVFDVGAFVGEWSLSVLSKHQVSQIYCFEPFFPSYKKLRENLSDFILWGKVIPCCISVGKRLDESTFWVYDDLPALNTKHRRDEQTLKRIGVDKQPRALNIATITIDVYCQCFDINHIDFLKIDTEGNELAVLEGAECLLEQHAIDHIQFEYGGCFSDACISLQEIFYFLKQYNFVLAKVHSGKLDFFEHFDFKWEDFNYCNYLAIRKK
jgi:FkbM family methyltransferase